MIVMCHRTYIWCLVIVVIKGSTIPRSIEQDASKHPTETILTKEKVDWDEDPNRWDTEIQVINPSSLSSSNTLSADTPHSEPLIAAIDFGRNNFGEDADSVKNKKTLEHGSSKESSVYAWGDKLSSSKRPNKNRRRKVTKNSKTSKNSRKKLNEREFTQIVNKFKKSTAKKQDKYKPKQDVIVSDIKWSAEETNDIENEHLNRSDIKNEEHLKNHRLNYYDSSHESAKYDEWPDIYNMFPDIETSGIQFDPGMFVNPYTEPKTHFNERIDEDDVDYAYDYYFDRIDQGIDQDYDVKSGHNDYDYVPNSFIDFTKDVNDFTKDVTNDEEFIPSLQIDPLFIPSPKIPFNADKNLLSQAIQYTEKPKSGIKNGKPSNPWKLSFRYPSSFSSSSSFSPVLSNSVLNNDFENPTRKKKNAFVSQFPSNNLYTTTKAPEPATYKLSTSHYKDKQDKNVDYVVSTNHAAFPSRKPHQQKRKNNLIQFVTPDQAKLFSDPIRNKKRQSKIPPPPLPPLRPNPTRKNIDFRRGFNRLKKLIRSIKLRRRRRLRKLRKGDGKRRKRKLVKSDLPQISISPYLKAPGFPEQPPDNRSKPKRRRRLRRKNPIGQRRNDDGNAPSTIPSKVAPRSIAYKMLDGLNRAARLSSEIILYLSFFALT